MFATKIFQYPYSYMRGVVAFVTRFGAKVRVLNRFQNFKSFERDPADYRIFCGLTLLQLNSTDQK